MSLRAQLVAAALRRRLRELCGERSRALVPQGFGPRAGFVARVREQLLAAAAGATVLRPLPRPEGGAAGVWLNSEPDCLTALRALSSGREFEFAPGEPPPAADFVTELRATRLEPERRFQLLCERYRCPLNVASASEEGAREHLLERLMVQDRTLLSRQSIKPPRADDVLLKLNLLAFCAASTQDLRFLDALNYYYERFPGAWQPGGAHGWLLASYYGLYARALVSRIESVGGP